MRKLFKFRRWLTIAPRVWRLLRSSRVPVGEKLLFLVPAALYWVLPDVIPFMPLDDIAVTVLLAGWFAGRMENRYFREDPWPEDKR